MPLSRTDMTEAANAGQFLALSLMVRDVYRLLAQTHPGAPQWLPTLAERLQRHVANADLDDFSPEMDEQIRLMAGDTIRSISKSMATGPSGPSGT